MHPTLELIRKLTLGTQFEGDLFLVGGAVRDEILFGQASEDLDLVSTRPSREIVDFLWQSDVCDHFPVVYERFGTAMVSIGGVKVEFVQTRKESYSARSRKPDVEPGTLLQDAQRRDFTINALLKSIHSGEIVDPLGTGLDDLRSRVLRTPLEPRKTFHDDPLRMLRAVRFRHRLGFEFAPGLSDSIRTSAPRLQIISKERIRDEFIKMLMHPSAADALNDLFELELLAQFAPEFTPLKGCTQGKFHIDDAWDHTRAVVNQVHHIANGEPELITVLAALLHDIAKPQTRTEPNPGEVHFYGHDHAGAAVARQVLKRLKFPSTTIQQVAFLVDNHMRLASHQEFGAPAIRRLIRDIGDLLPQFLDLCEADRLSHRHPEPLTDFRRRVAELQAQEPKDRLESPLSGEEIMSVLGLTQGRDVGLWKDRLTEARLDGTITDKESAEAWLTSEAKSARLPQEF